MPWKTQDDSTSRRYKWTVPCVLKGCGLLFSTLVCQAGLALAEPAPNRAESEQTATYIVPELSGNPSVRQLESARIFAEPLIPVGHEPTPQVNRQVVRVLKSYLRRSIPDDYSSLEQYVDSYPDSAWTPALLFNLATEYYNAGWYSKCLKTWEKAWLELKDATEPKAKALGDRAAGELAYMYARLGRMEDLSNLLDSVKDRTIIGSATERISGAKQGLWTMQNRPGIAFKCGPYALDSILSSRNPALAASPLIRDAQSTTNGCSLEQVAELSQQVALNYQMAYRSKGAPLMLPAVVNWKVGHYAALIKEEKGLYLLQDPTFGNDVWVSRRVLEDETSGYFLVPPGELPDGWRSVSEAEGRTVFGKGQTANSDENCTTSLDLQSRCSSGSGSSLRVRFNTRLRAIFMWAAGFIKTDSEPIVYGSLGRRGMASANAHLMLVSLHIQDTPVSYTPPVGGPLGFRAVYNQREAHQPAVFSYSNLGTKWTFNWLAYISDNPSSPSADVYYHVAGGGRLPFTGFDSDSQTFATQQKSQALLKRISTNSYEMAFRDGSRIIFAQPDSVGGTSRRVFMTQRVDPSGNAVSLTYDSSFRVTAITDAIGQVTTLSYEHPSDSLKITKVTDPFGRYATFDYDSSNRLAQITDPVGITSEFEYDSGDFITTLITPYGTNSFEKGESGRDRWLDLTFADGGRERVEYVDYYPYVPSSEPSSTVPVGMELYNGYLIYRNTFYWNRKAYADGAGDYTKAHIFHWLHQDYNLSGILESEKTPLENRVWRTYDGQPNAVQEGNTAQPNAIGRVLDDGTSQIVRFKYDAFGNVTNFIDPIGRSMTYVYATNGVDLLEVRQATGTNDDLLASFVYNTNHLPTAVWDAAGQMTTNTYNARGQLLTTTDPKGETTTLNYDTNGYLLAIDGMLPGSSDTSSFSYDLAGRVFTITDPDGYTITNSYDNLDRLTKVAYPDGTFSAYTYDKLDRVKFRDRLGRETVSTYDAVRRLTSVQDPLNRIVRFEYCDCGSLSALIDPMGRPTRWDYDVQGRVTSKKYVGGSQVHYTYEDTTSRLKSITDEQSQITSYDYNVDDTIAEISYSNAVQATPSVSFTYDTNYYRTVSMSDGLGSTTYAYHPAGGLGANRLASVDGPWSNDVVTYAYDALGRVTNRAIDGVDMATTFDELGRVTAMTNVLGSFSYSYDGPTRRLLTAHYPNGQVTDLSYFDNIGDRRLSGITNRYGATLISRFGYQYNAVGNITNWTQKLGTNAETSLFCDYDAADQLISAIRTDGTNTLKSYAYTYDPAANRTSETIDGLTRTFAYNALNEILTESNGTNAPVTYEWDAAHRLTAVNQATNRSEFYYDGFGRRVRIVEKENDVVFEDHAFLWCGLRICEERDATGSTVRKRFVNQGTHMAMGPSAGSYFHTRDHLGSLRELIDAAGAVRSRYDYGPYGERAKVTGDLDSEWGFTGYFLHTRSQLHLTMFRAYDSDKARWLSRDSLGEIRGQNLYIYAANNPMNWVDPLGLEGCPNSLSLTDRAKARMNMTADKVTETTQDAWNGAKDIWDEVEDYLPRSAGVVSSATKVLKVAARNIDNFIAGLVGAINRGSQIQELKERMEGTRNDLPVLEKLQELGAGN